MKQAATVLTFLFLLMLVAILVSHNNKQWLRGWGKRSVAGGAEAFGERARRDSPLNLNHNVLAKLPAAVSRIKCI